MTKRKIVCQWAQDKKLLINPDGQAWPCCYLSNPAYTVKIQKARDGKVTYGYDVVGHPIIQEYYAFEDELNVFKNDFDDLNDFYYLCIVFKSVDLFLLLYD